MLLRITLIIDWDRGFATVRGRCSRGVYCTPTALDMRQPLADSLVAMVFTIYAHFVQISMTAW